MSKQEILMNKIVAFYKEKNNFDIFLKYVRGETNIALRTLDWFATNYTKYRQVFVNGLNVQTDYRQQLKADQKEFFDPFKRKTRICLKWESNITGYKFTWEFTTAEKNSIENEIITTIGQLNFFKWIIQTKILNYIEENITDIVNYQNSFIDMKKNKLLKENIKNNSIIHKTVQKIVVTFDD